MLFLWKYSKIYYRKPMWLPVFYLSRSYSGIKNFTLRFYKILEDASKTLFRRVCLLVVWVFLTTNLVLYCLSQWSQSVRLTAIPRLFYISQPAAVEDLTANPVLLYMGQLLHGDALTSNQVIPKWVNGLGKFPWPHFHNSVLESIVEL